MICNTSRRATEQRSFEQLRLMLSVTDAWRRLKLNLQLSVPRFIVTAFLSLCFLPSCDSTEKDGPADELGRDAHNRELKAFPSAEGFGRMAKGGRGGKVIKVTNLNDAGANDKDANGYTNLEEYLNQLAIQLGR